MAEGSTSASIGRHGASRLPSVEVDSYNIELKDENGFLGDRASKGAFQAILDVWRKPLKKSGDDPFGNKSSESISKKGSTGFWSATTSRLLRCCTARWKTSRRNWLA